MFHAMHCLDMIREDGVGGGKGGDHSHEGHDHHHDDHQAEHVEHCFSYIAQVSWMILLIRAIVIHILCAVAGANAKSIPGLSLIAICMLLEKEFLPRNIHFSAHLPHPPPITAISTTHTELTLP